MAWSPRPLLALPLLAACPAGPANTSPGTTTDDPASTSSTSSQDTTDPLPTTGSTSQGTTQDPTLEPTTQSPETTFDPSTTTGDPACGDGVLDDGEACDDGNLVDGDCCSADCSVGPSEPGQVCWTVTFEGDKDAADRGVSVVLDAVTDVYVLATVVDSIPASDILVRRYDPGAVSQWTQQFDGGVNGTDLGLAMAGDPSGFMIAVGRQTVAQGEPSRMWLTKCTPTGQTLWSALDPGEVSGGGIAMADDAGEFIVVGAIDQGDKNAFVRRYDASGIELWTRTHAGVDAGTDTASGAAVDAAGNIYAVGREFTAAAGFDIWISRFGPDGTPGWSTIVDGPAGGPDWANDVAVDPDGNLLVAGRIAVDGSLADAWLRKLTPDGVEVWTQTFAGAAGESDEAVAVAVSPAGEIAVAGTTFVTDQGSDIFVRKHAPDGAEVWLRTHNGESNSDDQPGDVAIAPDGSVVVIGTVPVVPMVNSDVWLRKYSP